MCHAIVESGYAFRAYGADDGDGGGVAHDDGGGDDGDHDGRDADGDDDARDVDDDVHGLNAHHGGKRWCVCRIGPLREICHGGGEKNGHDVNGCVNDGGDGDGHADGVCV